MRILVVDDSGFTRALLRRDLRSEHEVLEAADGHEGLRILGSQAVDLVLVDLLMPRVDGFEFLNRARQMGFEGAVVVCSANTQSSVERRIKELGAAAFVAKPELMVPGRARRLVAEHAAPAPGEAESPGGMEELQEFLEAAMQAVAEVLSTVTGRRVKSRGLEVRDMDPPPEPEESSGPQGVHVTIDLGGGLTGRGHVWLPDRKMLEQAAEEACGGVPPPPSSLDVAAELGNLAVNAFVAHISALSGREVTLTTPTCRARWQEPGAAAATEDDRSVVVAARFAIEGSPEAALLELCLQPEGLSRLAAAVRAVEPVPSPDGDGRDGGD